ncbi:hypothetical protein C8R44DRAFT_798043 [Mycena epipterygia]|nr:hypothetical protein C8R44DRAFT_798043 [Mycena epipterygia]
MAFVGGSCLYLLSGLGGAPSFLALPSSPPRADLIACLSFLRMLSSSARRLSLLRASLALLLPPPCDASPPFSPLLRTHFP